MKCNSALGPESVTGCSKSRCTSQMTGADLCIIALGADANELQAQGNMTSNRFATVLMYLSGTSATVALAALKQRPGQTNCRPGHITNPKGAGQHFFAALKGPFLRCRCGGGRGDSADAWRLAGQRRASARLQAVSLCCRQCLCARKEGGRAPVLGSAP